MKQNKIGFTLIEILLAITIFSIVIIAGFQALSRVNIGKVKLYTETDIEKQAFYFSEKMFEMIKGAGTVDYEEYFNRKVVGDTSYASGHFDKPTGFGNFGSGGNLASNYGDLFYYCLSGIGISMGTGGCYNNNFNTYGTDLIGKLQRYGEYYYQFIDYNSNQDDDASQCGAGFSIGDEDCDGNIMRDDDDEYLGVGPEVFTGGTNVKELYFISGDGKKRTFFRWNVKVDPDAPASFSGCTISSTDGTAIGSGCLGNIQFLKLDGKDWGFSHDKSGTGLYDGVIDTWLYDENIYGTGLIAGTGTIQEQDSKWVDIFPNYINVKDVSFFIYPNKDYNYNWGDQGGQSNISPYVRLNLTLTPAWKKKGGIKGKIPEIKFSTSIALNSF
ncbi:MAG: prepilin-type N-terminal cleavage/methylation domain-containing protein [Candidatus Gracilibacteria bacterium]|nr:prepilin-type N-terminal cleavage/methylation domain-containing protein [Candidatus Gracilibacteria bacterium]